MAMTSALQRAVRGWDWTANTWHKCMHTHTLNQAPITPHTKTQWDKDACYSHTTNKNARTTTGWTHALLVHVCMVWKGTSAPLTRALSCVSSLLPFPSEPTSEIQPRPSYPRQWPGRRSAGWLGSGSSQIQVQRLHTMVYRQPLSQLSVSIPEPVWMYYI